jgi:hypothetical protein
MSSTATFSGTSSTAPRKKTPVWRTVFNTGRKAGGELLDLQTRTKEGVKFEAKTVGGTAAWRWETSGARPYHLVILDPDFTATCDRPSRPSRRTLCEYGAALLRHEKWHGLITDRDLDTLARRAASMGIPFTLLNVVEDMRIEHRARNDEAKYFLWHHFNRGALCRVDEPVLWLCLFVMEESSARQLVPFTRNVHLLPDWDGIARVKRVRSGVEGPERDTLDVLVEFCEEICTAPDTASLLPILADFLATFPTAKRDPKSIPGVPSRIAGTGYTEGRSARTTDATRYDGKVNTVDPSQLSPVERATLGYFMHINDVRALNMSDEEYERTAGRLANLSQSSAVAQRLATMLGTIDSPRTRTATSGNRVHVRGVMTGDAASFRVSDVRGGKRSVLAIFDQSGSMGADWRRHGAAFASALLQLHQRGTLDVTVALTGGRRHAILPPWFPPALVNRFACGLGCESVDATLTALREHVMRADTVLIYTDGHLTDGDVDAGKYRSLGVDLVGCAVGGPSIHEMLTTHFSRGITAESGTQLATRIVQYIATRKASR